MAVGVCRQYAWGRVGRKENGLEIVWTLRRVDQKIIVNYAGGEVVEPRCVVDKQGRREMPDLTSGILRESI